MWCSICERGQTDRQTDDETDVLITIVCTLQGDVIIIITEWVDAEGKAICSVRQPFSVGYPTVCFHSIYLSIRFYRPKKGCEQGRSHEFHLDGGGGYKF